MLVRRLAMLPGNDVFNVMLEERLVILMGAAVLATIIRSLTNEFA